MGKLPLLLRNKSILSKRKCHSAAIDNTKNGKANGPKSKSVVTNFFELTGTWFIPGCFQITLFMQLTPWSNRKVLITLTLLKVEKCKNLMLYPIQTGLSGPFLRTVGASPAPSR